MESAKPTGTADEMSAAPDVMGNVSALWHELRGAVHDQLQLALLEAKLAGTSLATIVAAGVMVALLVVTAWLGLVGAVVLWLIGMGIAASIAMLIAVVFNVGAALALYFLIRRQSRHLQFPATLRSLRPVPAEDRS